MNLMDFMIYEPRLFYHCELTVLTRSVLRANRFDKMERFVDVYSADKRRGYTNQAACYGALDKCGLLDPNGAN